MFGTRCIMIRIDCPMIWQLMHASTMCVAIGLAIAWLVIRLTQTVIFKLQKKR